MGPRLVVLILSLAGGFLLWWPFDDDRQLEWYRRHLAITEGQLQGLKELLHDYKQRHGRYPTNDEGLSVLDNFESRFTISVYRPRDRMQSPEPVFCGNDVDDFWWTISKRSIDEYRHQYGHLPRNADEFCETRLGCFFRRKPDDETEQLPTHVELAFDRHSNVYLFDQAGVSSPWLLPYLYENRAGYKPEAFRRSPAEDRWGYSTEVDDGVYLFSSGAYVHAKQLSALWWQRHGPQMVGGVLIFLGVALAVSIAIRTRRGRSLLGILAVVPGFFGGGALYAMNFATCYVMAQLFSRRTPEMVALQRELLANYRQSGVISEETYRRALSSAVFENAEPRDTESPPQ